MKVLSGFSGKDKLLVGLRVELKLRAAGRMQGVRLSKGGRVSLIVHHFRLVD